MNALSGNQGISCKTFPRVATRRGLPLIIPGPIRLRMEAKDAGVIKLTLSMLSVYRVIKIRGLLKLSTITAPFGGLSVSPPIKEISLVSGMLRLRKKFNLIPGTRLIPSPKAGPNFGVAALGLTLDAYAFKENPELLSQLEKVAAVTGKEVFNLLQEEISYLPTWLATIDRKVRTLLESTKLGKLAEKEEAAGKIRVFAITDIWSQSTLEPLHDALFRLLRGFATDGTFDQLSPIKRLIDMKCDEFYSFDLTAATDRLPIQFQKNILTELTGNIEFSEA
jgi:hypothetical protein